MALVMLRHTRPNIDEGVCYGHTDIDVAASFEKESNAVLAKLPAISHIVSSPLRRCRKLADRIAANHGYSVRIDSRLTEMNFGRWEGVEWDRIPRAELDAWAADFYFARPHGGESVSDLKTRVDAAISELHRESGNGLVVTHGGVIRAARANGTASDEYQTRIAFGEMIHLPEQKEENHD